MAKSIYDVLAEGETITSVKGVGDFNMTLPANMPTAEEFELPEKLLAWANEQGTVCLHSVLQSGIQKKLIDLRATFRAVKKGESWNIKTAQSNVDTAEWTITKRPNVGGSGKAVETALYAKCLTSIQKMVAKGMDEETIRDIQADFGKDVLNGCFDALKNQTS